MAKNYFKSYIWLLETLQSRGPLTLKEIKSLWLDSSVNDEGKNLATRTFANHIYAIADIFGIDIVCDRRDNTYYIENAEDMNGRGIRNWMLNALSLNSLLSEGASLRDRIFFDEVPSKDKFLAIVIQAIRDGRKLDICYKSFRKDYEENFVFEPYFLKEFKRRWYLYGYKGDKDGCRMIALDRMITAVITSECFTLPKEFSAKDYFGNIYGVLCTFVDYREQISIGIVRIHKIFVQQISNLITCRFVDTIQRRNCYIFCKLTLFHNSIWECTRRTFCVHNISVMNYVIIRCVRSRHAFTQVLALIYYTTIYCN